MLGSYWNWISELSDIFFKQLPLLLISLSFYGLKKYVSLFFICTTSGRRTLTKTKFARSFVAFLKAMCQGYISKNKICFSHPTSLPPPQKKKKKVIARKTIPSWKFKKFWFSCILFVQHCTTPLIKNHLQNITFPRVFIKCKLWMRGNFSQILRMNINKLMKNVLKVLWLNSFFRFLNEDPLWVVQICLCSEVV